MNNYIVIKIINKLLQRDGKSSCDKINEYFRGQGAQVGQNCRIYSDILSSEPYLIEIGSNVTISNGVQFLTHDNSIIKACVDKTDLFGAIKIGNNCFIGAHVIIMPGVTLGNNCIVGAGSVVVKSFPDGTVVAGNPAKVITTFEKFKEKNENKGLNIDGLSTSEKRKLILNNRDKWILR